MSLSTSYFGNGTWLCLVDGEVFDVASSQEEATMKTVDSLPPETESIRRRRWESGGKTKTFYLIERRDDGVEPWWYVYEVRSGVVRVSRRRYGSISRAGYYSLGVARRHYEKARRGDEYIPW